MSRFMKKMSQTIGRAPGELVLVGEARKEKVKITVIDYDEKNFQEKEVADVEECLHFKDSPTMTWVNISGIHDTAIVEKTGAVFDIHPLVLEDILDTGQRPKIEDFDRYFFIVVKMLYHGREGKEIETEQVSLILGKNFVVSFQEREGDVFGPVRDRLRNVKGRVRKMGVDYLAYTLLDAIVDNYFIILEKLGDKIEDMEADLVKDPGPRTLQAIHSLKQDTIFLRKSVWPLREVISKLERNESVLIKKSTAVYLRDVYDHTIQVIDTVETFRDVASGMLEIYLSSVSNRMNEVMKTLTIIATIFIPLTFVAGIYGMNFRYMPELEKAWGYPLVWGVNIIIAALMLLYFKKKRWI